MLIRAATDWRAVVRVLGPRGAAWSLPLADVIWGAVCLMAAIASASFLSRFGVHFVYVADLVLHVLIASAQLLRRRALRASFVVTAVGLALYALLTYSSPVALGLSPLSLTALTSLHAVVRWSPDGRWRRAALGAALAGAVLNPINMLALGYQDVIRRVDRAAFYGVIATAYAIVAKYEFIFTWSVGDDCFA